jgi:hypothetical protein
MRPPAAAAETAHNHRPYRAASSCSPRSCPQRRRFLSGPGHVLSATPGQHGPPAEEVPWQEHERLLYGGEAQLGVVCGLQHVYAVDRGERSGVELVAAPVMRGERYLGRSIYFSDVVVRREGPARCLADLRGAAWAYNEPSSQSGYNRPRYVLATRGEKRRALRTGGDVPSAPALVGADTVWNRRRRLYRHDCTGTGVTSAPGTDRAVVGDRDPGAEGQSFCP